MLKLEVSNSDADLEQHRLEKTVAYYKCNRCKHRWQATLAEMFEDPTCRKCHK